MNPKPRAYFSRGLGWVYDTGPGGMMLVSASWQGVKRMVDQYLEAGHKYISSLNLDAEKKAVLRVNAVQHRTYPHGVKSSVFRDNADVCDVLRMPVEEPNADR